MTFCSRFARAEGGGLSVIAPGKDASQQCRRPRQAEENLVRYSGLKAEACSWHPPAATVVAEEDPLPEAP